jgi:hypothetical protein
MNKRIGTYPVGNINVDVYVSDSENLYESRPSEQDKPRITICLRWDRFSGVLCNALHESFEMLTTCRGCQFEETHGWHDGSGGLYVMTHAQMTQIMGDVAIFVNAVQRDLWRAWRNDVKKRKQVKK